MDHSTLRFFSQLFTFLIHLCTKHAPSVPNGGAWLLNVDVVCCQYLPYCANGIDPFNGDGSLGSLVELE